MTPAQTGNTPESCQEDILQSSGVHPVVKIVG